MSKSNSNLPSGLQILKAKRQHQIKYIDDERDMGEGYWIYLKAGWSKGDEPGCHIIHEDTVKDCAKQMTAVVACQCDDCLNLAAQKRDF